MKGSVNRPTAGHRQPAFPFCKYTPIPADSYGQQKARRQSSVLIDPASFLPDDQKKTAPLVSSGFSGHQNPPVVWVDTWIPPTVQKLYNIACFCCLRHPHRQPRGHPPLCESGGTGRRARLRISWATVGVQVPPLAPLHEYGRDTPGCWVKDQIYDHES